MECSWSARLLRGGSEAAEGDVGDEDEGGDGRAGPGSDGGEGDRLGQQVLYSMDIVHS